MALYDPDHFTATPAQRAAACAGVTVEHAANLLGLADLLDRVRSKQHFSMATFGSYVGPQPECRTVACALGHLPLTGVRRLGECESWGDYGARTTGVQPATWQWTWLFGGVWTSLDGSPAAAAARIRFLCTEQSPESRPEIQAMRDALRPESSGGQLLEAARRARELYRKYRRD